MKPKNQRYKTGEKALSPKQQEEVIAVLESYRDEVLIKLTLSLGCRRADIVRIEWSNVLFDENTIHYHERKKGDKLHTAFVSTEIMQMLKRHRRISTGRWLFPGERCNEHLSGRTAYNILSRAMKKAGLIKEDGCHPFHALRATCIKNSQRAGWSQQTTASHVNDDVRVIEKHYKVPSLSERKQAAMEKPIQ